jgi:hypothetical protein
LFSDLEGVPLHTLGVVKKERLQFPKSDSGTVEELRHLPTAHDRQIPTKQHPIETRKHTMNPVLVLLREFLHDFSPRPLSKRRDQPGRINTQWSRYERLSEAEGMGTGPPVGFDCLPTDRFFSTRWNLRSDSADSPVCVLDSIQYRRRLWAGRGCWLARFCLIARGSASELEYQILLAHDLNLIPLDHYDELTQQITEIKRMLTVLVQKLNADRWTLIARGLPFPKFGCGQRPR